MRKTRRTNRIVRIVVPTVARTELSSGTEVFTAIHPEGSGLSADGTSAREAVGALREILDEHSTDYLLDPPSIDLSICWMAFTSDGAEANTPAISWKIPGRILPRAQIVKEPSGEGGWVYVSMFVGTRYTAQGDTEAEAVQRLAASLPEINENRRERGMPPLVDDEYAHLLSEAGP